jgi:acyl-CoA hydrolase
VLDNLAEETALAYARRTEPEARVVTAAIDDMILHTPAHLTKDLNLHARINYVGRTSMEVGIRVDQPGTGTQPLASCYFTMVARVREGAEVRNLPIESLEYGDPVEECRRDAAIERRRQYSQQQEAATQPPSLEEFRLLQELHSAQDRPGFDGLLIKNLVRSSWDRMYPEHENVPQKIFGGYVIRQALELALSHAEELVSHRPVVVRVNRINFLQPVRIGDQLHFTSRIVFTGRSSVSVEIDIERTSMDKVTKALSNTCVFTFVNVDEQMRAQPVPQVFPSTYAEDARYLEAYRRDRQHRQARA